MCIYFVHCCNSRDYYFNMCVTEQNKSIHFFSVTTSLWAYVELSFSPGNLVLFPLNFPFDFDVLFEFKSIDLAEINYTCGFLR